MKKKITIDRAWLWLSVIMLFIWMALANVYAHIMSTPVDGNLQLLASFLFLIFTFYAARYVWKKLSTNLLKKKEHDHN
jgi:hypothetical protein